MEHCFHQIIQAVEEEQKNIITLIISHHFTKEDSIRVEREGDRHIERKKER